jgi:geranylgeranyl diphosphate synthase type I
MTTPNELENFNRVLTRFGGVLDAQIQMELATGPGEIEEASEFMRNAIRYHFGWCDQNFQPTPGGNSGKKLRPVMALLAYQGVHPQQTQADLAPVLPLAAAIEMIHNYSLIHDDIEDEDPERRGRATSWTIWGKAKAINIGDCLHMLSFRKLYRANENGLSVAKTFQAAQYLTNTCVKLAQGQHQDMSFEENLAVTPQAYLDMISGKTAALIRCAVWMGAMAAVSENETERLAAFAQFGEEIGIGFQMRDDILGIWGIAEETGKPVANDIRRRKKSLPIIFALNNCKGQAQQRLLEIYRHNQAMDEDEVNFVLTQLAECGAREFVQGRADYHKGQALQALEKASGGAAQLEQNAPLLQLKQLSTFLVERSF